MEKGWTYEDVAEVLGNSAAIVKKHYAKWSPEYQRRTVEIMRRIHGTPTARDGMLTLNAGNKRDYLVLEEGVEPSCPVKGAGF